MTDGFRMSIKKPLDEKAAARKAASKQLRAITKKYCERTALKNERIAVLAVGNDGFEWANIFKHEGNRTAVVSRSEKKGGAVGINSRVVQYLFDHELPLRLLLDDTKSRGVFYEYDAMRILGDDATRQEGSTVWFRMGLGVRVPFRSEREHEGVPREHSDKDDLMGFTKDDIF